MTGRDKKIRKLGKAVVRSLKNRGGRRVRKYGETRDRLSRSRIDYARRKSAGWIRLESMSGNRKERGRKDIETVLTEDEAPSSGEFEPVQGSAGVRDKGCV